MELCPKERALVPVDVLAVVVAYNSEAVLGRSVRALSMAADELRGARGAETALVVVDNASRIPASPPDVPLDVTTLRLESNLGFAPAANLGAKHRRSRLILFLNPDTELAPTALTRLVDAFDLPETALAGPLLVGEGGEPMVSERPFHSLRRELRTQLLLRRREAPCGHRARATGHGRCLTGACMLADRSFFESVGGFDVAVRMYLEDVELCWRAHDAWRSVRFVEDALCVHGLGASSGGDNFTTRVELHLTLLAARVEFVRRRSGVVAAAAMRVSIAIGAAGRIGVAALGRRASHRHFAVLRWATTDGAPPSWGSLEHGAQPASPASVGSPRLREEVT